MSNFDINKQVKILINQLKALEKNIERTLNDAATPPHSRYVSFKSYAEMFNVIAREAENVLGLKNESFTVFYTDRMGSYGSTLWGEQKQIVENVSLNAGFLLSYLESYTDFAEDEFDSISNFIRSKLRSSIFSIPAKETEVQNAIESLLIGRNMIKGIDYDRETGKFEFSGKEYIPDFILPKMNLCLEVKLLREGKRSRIIDEINADITAYSTKYERLLFVVYDLGIIRDETEFCRDIENAGANIKVVIVKN